MKKKFVSLLMALLLCVGVAPMFTACGPKADVTVMLMGNNIETQFYTQHFKKVEEQMGIKIDVNVEASENYYNTLQVDINAGKTPDIIYVRPSDLRRFIRQNIITDIGSMLNADYASTVAKIEPKAMESYRYDKNTKTFGTGGTYAVPKDLSVQQLGYNKTILEQAEQAIRAAGIAKMPWEMDWSKENYTWEQFKTMAKIVAETTPPENPNFNSYYGCDIPDIEILTWSFGGSIVSADGQTVQIDSQAFKSAASYIAELIDCGAANYQGATYANFASVGRVGFYGLVNSFDIKNFDENFKSRNQEWDIMPWPVVDNSTEEKATAWYGKITSAGYAVTNDCKNKEQALKVIMTLFENQTQTQLVTDKLMLPLFTDMATTFVDPTYDDMYSPEHRSIYIDVITGKNGKFSDDYKTYELSWQSPYTTEYLEIMYASEKGQAASKLKDAAGYATLQSSVQEQYSRQNSN